ncbi:MAG TPA: DUF4123 domain-containing protein [Candidatus Angelobacter sp.]|nr:DUF4123 domain-containing protein [Candidatus Angelobacter sp.]
MLHQREISPAQLAQLADGGYVFAIVDACVDRKRVMHKAYNEMGPSRAISLFQGTYMEGYDAAAPYLFHVDREVLEWIPAKLDQSRWGVFVMTKEPREVLVPHLQRFLMVTLPDGRKGYFRYYDPRILGAYLPTCQPAELQTFFGAVRGFATMDETGNMVFELSAAPCAGYSQLPIHPSGLWAIRAEQMAAFSDLSKEHFAKKVVAHLQEFFPEHCELLGEGCVRRFVHDGIQAAYEYGITTEPEVCVFVDFLFAFGSEFEQDAQFEWAKTILKDRSRSAADRIAQVRKSVEQMMSEDN